MPKAPKKSPAKKKKPVAKAAGFVVKKKTTKAKPKAKPALKKKKPAPKKKKPAPPKKKAKKAPRVAAIAEAVTARGNLVEKLGAITVPSGNLALFDIGLYGYMPRETLEPAIVKCPVPSDRPLDVIGTRVGRGRFAEAWDHVTINLRPGDVYHSKKLGEVGVDFARIVCMDHTALDQWKHDESLDGLADVVFWGRDEADLARTLRATRMKEGYGWKDIPLEDAESKVFECEIQKAENKWLLAIDFRPHSHHFQILAAARANPLGAGTLELGGTQMMLFFTSWGDGVYPIYLDLDADDNPVRVRIQLATADSVRVDGHGGAGAGALQ